MIVIYLRLLLLGPAQVFANDANLQVILSGPKTNCGWQSAGMKVFFL
jgi:hypothetical protein